MAEFLISIKTQTRHRPVTRGEEILEIRRLEQTIVLIASAMSSRGLHDGDVTGIDCD